MWKKLDYHTLSNEEFELFKFLDSNVIGQKRAKEKVANKLVADRHGIRNPLQPKMALCFLGPSGVGKTLIARKIAKLLLGREDALIKIDCSTMQQKHDASRLIGPPPGYIGFDGVPELSQEKLDYWGNRLLKKNSKKSEMLNKFLVLSDEDRFFLLQILEEKSQYGERNKEIKKQLEDLKKILYGDELPPKDELKCLEEIYALENEEKYIKARIAEIEEDTKDILSKSTGTKTEEQHPVSILLLDEIEKLHHEIMTMFLSVFDDGTLPSAKGGRTNFRNCIIIMTSNLGSGKLTEYASGRGGPIGYDTKTTEEKNDPDDRTAIYNLVINEVQTSPHFPTELIGRIGKESFIVFDILNDDEMRKVIDIELNKLLIRVQMSLPDTRIEFTGKLREYLLTETKDKMNKSLGARPIEKVINDRIIPAITNLIVKAENGGIVAGDRIKIDTETYKNARGIEKTRIDIQKFSPDLLPEPKKEE